MKCIEVGIDANTVISNKNKLTIFAGPCSVENEKMHITYLRNYI